MTVKKESIDEEPKSEIMTTADLGDMYFAFEKVLIVRSSSNMLLFRKVEVEIDAEEEESEESDQAQSVWKWKQIFKIP